MERTHRDVLATCIQQTMGIRDLVFRFTSPVLIRFTLTTGGAHSASLIEDAVAWIDQTVKTKFMEVFGSGVRGDASSATLLLFEVAPLARAQLSGTRRATERSNVGRRWSTKRSIRLLMVVYQSGAFKSSEVT